ncbi:MAG: hypothetical protein ACTSPS_11175 [Promethearchaeota archaeon]
MLGDLSDEEANELIALFSKSMIDNIVVRSASVETKIFPVNHYINVACYILYDQSYQYDILKKVASKISPEEIAERSKTLCAPLNQLAFYSIAMLYLQGRGNIINDNIHKKTSSDQNMVIEPETKKKELKFILDFWRRLSPNYRNDGELTAKNKNILILSQDNINKLRDQMIYIGDDKEKVKKLKVTMAHLTIFNFLFQAECRAGIFEHGPYYFEGNPKPLIFKEFQFLYSDEEIYGINLSGYIPHKITNPSPVSNVIFGYTLKGMNKIEFNDWGTLFSDPSDLSSKISSVGIWTKELIQIPLSFNILDKLSEFAKNATRELYIDYARWSFIKKLMLGTQNYANNCLAICTSYAGIENDFDWTWGNDYVLDKPFKTELLDKEKIKFYIDRLKRWDGGHPFIKRIVRGRKIRKSDPFYYYLQN